MARLRRFVIERDIPGFGAMSIVEMCGAARASNQAIDKIGTAIQWQHSYVSADKLFCVYLASDEAAIRKHSELSGIPVTNITEITQIIDPLTANN
jgi:Nickel responsive protein SCO4226-like